MSDIIRVGYISAINYTDGTAQVVYKDRDNAVSPYMPFFSNEFDPPPVETLVYVAMRWIPGKNWSISRTYNQWNF